MLRAVAVAALLSAVLAGCGSVPEETEEASSSEVRTVRFESTTEFDSGSEDWGGPSRTVIDGSVDLVSGDFRLSQRGEGGSLTLAVDGVVYSRWESVPVLPAGKSWVSQEVGDESLASATEVGLDPRKVVENAEAIYGALREVGQETVDGVDTTHFHGEAGGMGTSEPVTSTDGEVGSGGIAGVATCGRYSLELKEVEEPTVTVVEDFGKATRFETTQEIDVWVDDEGFARRVVLAESGGYHRKTTLRFYDFGIPVTVVPPPADAVISFDEFWDLVMNQDEGGCIEADR